MIQKILRGFGVAALLLSAVMWVGMGCEGDGDSAGNSTDNSAFVGTWAIYDQTAGPGVRPWYVTFRADGTWFFSDAAGGPPDDSGVKTYTVSNGRLVGAFTNPHAGDGHIEATITGNTMQLNFIEHWHDPYVVIPFSGTKV